MEQQHVRLPAQVALRPPQRGYARRVGAGAARAARVVVPDFQLSLAIGKEGQNARLAARLTGWRIDIRSDEAAPEGAEVSGTDRASEAEQGGS
jgi:N utilization substance protein A